MKRLLNPSKEISASLADNSSVCCQMKLNTIKGSTYAMCCIQRMLNNRCYKNRDYTVSVWRSKKDYTTIRAIALVLMREDSSIPHA
jgi:hypothetical protein